jgi:GTPase SAR1 family protein
MQLMQTAMKLADDNGLLYFETSAKNGDNVQEVFLQVAKKVLDRAPASSTSLLFEPQQNLQLHQPAQQHGSCSC